MNSTFFMLMKFFIIWFSHAIRIRGHKGQNSTETWCRGFLVLESRCCGFLSSEKMPWNDVSPCRDVLVPESLCRGFLVLESRCRGFLVLGSRFRDFFGLGISMSWYVPPRPRFRFHSEDRKITQNILNYVKEYFNYPNLCNSYPYKSWISYSL